MDLKSLRGQNIVLYFYPKDDTSGCTSESCDFKANHRKFKRANYCRPRHIERHDGVP